MDHIYIYIAMPVLIMNVDWIWAINKIKLLEYRVLKPFESVIVGAGP